MQMVLCSSSFLCSCCKYGLTEPIEARPNGHHFEVLLGMVAGRLARLMGKRYAPTGAPITRKCPFPCITAL